MKNKARLLSVILTLTFLISAFPVTASAADYTPSDGDILDISACVSGDVITIGAGRSVTLTGSSVTLTNVRIICEAGVNLTLQNVIINNGSYSGACPLTFTGADSKLILESGTTSALTGGPSAPGISVEAAAELALENNGTLTLKVGPTKWVGSACAGLQCLYGATLTVSGEGTLDAMGNNGGAGIGGSYKAACGSITINSGTVIATGGSIRVTNTFYHAIDGGVITISGGTVNSANTVYGGIGGNSNEGSSISITGGNITATSAPGAIGIGGMGSLGCDVTITGGTVIATSNKIAPIGRSNHSLSGTVVISGGTVIAQSGGFNFGGIDCSYNASGTVTITGGTVTATGGNLGAGICASGFNYVGSALGTGSVTISGGTVTATGGTNGVGICASSTGAGSVIISGGTVYTGGGKCDLGSGLAGTEETLSIEGTAKVFLQNNTCTTPATTTHTNLTYPIDTAEVYGTVISVPGTWTTNFGAYLRPCTLSYDINGGSGTVPKSVTRLYDAAVTLYGGSGLSREGFNFSGWNTAANGSGDSYDAGDNFICKANTTLFTQWDSENNKDEVDIWKTREDKPENTINKTDTNITVMPESIERGDLVSVTPNGDAFNRPVELRIKEDDAVKQAIEEAMNDAEGRTVYPLDIGFYEKGANTKVQPAEGSSVTITCPVPDELLGDLEHLTVVCLIDGNLQTLPSVITQKNGVTCLVFTASHFSPYAFVVNRPADVTTTMSETVASNPNTGVKTGSESLGDALLMAVSLGAMLIWAQQRRNK